MRRNTAHGVHGDRPANHLVVFAPGPVGPLDVELDFLFESGVGQFSGQAVHFTEAVQQTFRTEIGADARI